MHLVDIGQKSNDRLEHEDEHQQDCVLWTRIVIIIVSTLSIRIKMIEIPPPSYYNASGQRLSRAMAM